MKILSIWLLTSATLLFTSCSNISTADYSQNTPRIVLHDFFDGDLTAKGVVKNRSGKVIRHFTATIKASWQNNIGTLDEKFVFNDGEIQYRIWTLTPTAKNTFIATARDVVGTGRGEYSGNAINLKYVLAIKYKSSTINVKVNDWMWLVDEKTVINESTLTKFGFNVGSVQLVINKN